VEQSCATCTRARWGSPNAGGLTRTLGTPGKPATSNSSMSAAYSNEALLIRSAMACVETLMTYSPVASMLQASVASRFRGGRGRREHARHRGMAAAIEERKRREFPRPPALERTHERNRARSNDAHRSMREARWYSGAAGIELRHARAPQLVAD